MSRGATEGVETIRWLAGLRGALAGDVRGSEGTHFFSGNGVHAVASFGRVRDLVLELETEEVSVRPSAELETRCPQLCVPSHKDDEDGYEARGPDRHAELRAARW